MATEPRQIADLVRVVDDTIRAWLGFGVRDLPPGAGLAEAIVAALRDAGFFPGPIDQRGLVSGRPSRDSPRSPDVHD